MKLSAKVNFIILPVMLVIFSLAGILSYNSQKAQLISSLSEKIEYELKHISGSLKDSLYELDSVANMFLGGQSVNKYLNSLRFDSNKNYANKELVESINQLELRGGEIVSFGILNSDKKEVFLYDSEDPFATIELTEAITEHFSYINESIKPQGVSDLQPSRYQLLMTEKRGNEILWIRTFSPDQAISTTSFSKGHSIYTAIIKLRLPKTTNYMHELKSTLGENVLIDVSPIGHSQTMESVTTLNFVNDKNINYGLYLANQLWKIEVSVPYTYLDKLYQPYRFLFISIVIAVTGITFILLKSLITSRIINPVVNLTKQVEDTVPGEKLRIARLQSNDEVSLLTNKYIDLIMKLDNIAKYDHLTGLANRIQFQLELSKIVSNSFNQQTRFAMFYIDLNNFKSVNDRFGHFIGDQVLKVFSTRLAEALHETNLTHRNENQCDIARLSGDEFALVIHNVTDMDNVVQAAKNIISLFDEGFRIDNHLFDIGISIGIAMYPDDAEDADHVIKKADIAMYSAKNCSHSAYQFYTSKLSYEIERYEKVTISLKDALIKNEFYLVYMPIYDCQNGSLRGCEVLLRSTNETLAVYGPEQFIPIAEKSGLIKDIDYWVLETAFQKLSEWIKEFSFSGVLAINFSSWQLKNPEFVEKVSGLIDTYQVPPQLIELEITETCFVPGEHKNGDILSALHSLGVNLSLDDFGTGFTAFSQLIDYPVDILKIDRMFINEIHQTESRDRPLVDIIVEVAKLYHLEVVAEGVETEEQLNYVRALGCQLVQGYFLSKPLPEMEFVLLLKKKNRLVSEIILDKEGNDDLSSPRCQVL
jgi:diguanylate cyclase (GGDEF)-like protein